MAKTNPLVEALLSTRPDTRSSQGRILDLFGDQPDVLDAIVTARRDRKLTYSQIAKVLTTPDNPVSDGVVKTFCVQRGLP